MTSTNNKRTEKWGGCAVGIIAAQVEAEPVVVRAPLGWTLVEAMEESERALARLAQPRSVLLPVVTLG